ncbi:MAG TPA: YciI family protein [Spirochaetia bacterium]|nr:YciI family protein [Spirochaetia bacterium]
MKYMLLMSGTKAEFDEYAKWSRDELRAVTNFMRSFSKELDESGVLVLTEGLGFPAQAKTVRAGSNGEPITDGVFPESKEFLAGFWIIDVESPEEAYRIAARASAGPGLKHRGTQAIEVRQVMERAPEEWQ